MRIEQISIFLENKTGRIAEVTSILFDAKVNIRALSLADTSDFGVLRLIVDDNQKAKEALTNEGFTVRKTDVLAVHVPDVPGGLHRILLVLHENNINIEYMYSLVTSKKDQAILIFRFENLEQAEKILTQNGINIVQSQHIYRL